MPTLASDITVDLGWRWLESLGIGNVVDKGNLKVTSRFADGESDGKANREFYDRRTLLATANETLDLQALSRTQFADTHNVNLRKVKLLLVRNLSTDYDIVVGNSGSNAFNQPFNDLDAGAQIVQKGGNGLYLNVAPGEGWFVEPLRKDLKIENLGAGPAQYDIFILGVAALSPSSSSSGA